MFAGQPDVPGSPRSKSRDPSVAALPILLGRAAADADGTKHPAVAVSDHDRAGPGDQR